MVAGGRRVGSLDRSGSAGGGGVRVRSSGGGAMSLRLVGLAAGTALNATWRQKGVPTNVLAFPVPRLGLGVDSGLPREYGDLVFCVPVLLREAGEQGKEPLHHLAHLVVHGTLHLLGYTHEEEAEAASMEALESRILQGMGIPDPYIR